MSPSHQDRYVGSCNRHPLRFPDQSRGSNHTHASERLLTTAGHDDRSDVKGFSAGSVRFPASLGRKCEKVSECMDAATKPGWTLRSLTPFSISLNTNPFWSVIPAETYGIVTTADLSLHSPIGEPFLLLGQIENHVRNLMADKYTANELAAARDPLMVTEISRCLGPHLANTFGFLRIRSAGKACRQN